VPKALPAPFFRLFIYISAMDQAMHRATGFAQKLPWRRRLAIVLGTNEIASAVAVYLRKSGWAVILSYDPLPPVMRRGMSFHDALFGDPAHLEGIEAERIDFVMEAYDVFPRENRVCITWLGLTELLVLGSVDLLIDARLQKHVGKPDLRGLAKMAVGLGPGFFVHGNCDIAVETKPSMNGTILMHGFTEAADGQSINLGTAGAERFVRAKYEGHWHTSLDLGVRIYKDVVVGHLDGEPLRAPIDGVLRGLVRDGTEIPAGAKILEIDPRCGRAAKWTGIDERSRQIAAATRRAVNIYETEHGRVRHTPLYQ
jgi:hypothetical protein